MHLDILSNVKSFGDHRLSSIVEVVEEKEKKMERKRRMTFIVTIKRF